MVACLPLHASWDRAELIHTCTLPEQATVTLHSAPMHAEWSLQLQGTILYASFSSGTTARNALGNI